ncbi:hypothetical protein UACE39S_01348 [Ureibacillus acetophenoni]
MPIINPTKLAITTFNVLFGLIGVGSLASVAYVKILILSTFIKLGISSLKTSAILFAILTASSGCSSSTLILTIFELLSLETDIFSAN